MKLIAILFAMGTCLALGACATSSGDEQPVPVVVPGSEQTRIDTGGIPPDKQADIILVLQQRDASGAPVLPGRAQREEDP